ncbi:unnamed protein product [Hermetia illucens]|uniref:Uncharacterized protein n=1 Tax=Hermetia illucens TaxID=343691 RepID=A0A7R8V433_HERIL|nr:unnamed protein product [Hermetia illucens]
MFDQSSEEACKMQEDNNAFETSIDSGISIDITSPSAEEKAENKMKTYQQILFALERDKLLRAEQRKRLSQISERRQRKKRTEEPCNVCCINLDTENIKSSVKCVNCQKIACRGQSCSIWIPSQSGWECQLCNQSQESISKSSEWLNQQIAGKYLNPLSARSEPALQRSGLSPQPELDRQSDAASSYYGEQKERVREMIEETLAEMLGGSLDNISVNQLYKSRQYLPTWENGEAPGISQLKLKRFIEKIINDTLRLPDFTNEPLTPGPTYDQNLPFFDPKKYQELLATAVLNKIVDSYNYEQKFDKIKDAATDCSDLDKNHNALIGRKVQSGSVSSSSIEPESDCSITDPPTNISRCNDFSRSDSGSNLFSDILNRGDQNDSSMLSKYLAKHNVPLPDFSIDSDSSVEDNIPSEDHFGNTWEGNWLFKKKRPGHESPAAVGMLVPCPKEDVKTQIGDKTADELSDLSEAGSECGDNNIDEIEDNPPNALIQNRNIIGGKSPIGIFDELLEQTSLISTSSIPDGDTLYTETKNNFVLGDDLEHDLPKHNGHFHTDEAINSLVDTQQLQNNLSRSKEWGRKSHMKENINESQASRMRSAQKHPIYISTKDIPESELTSSSTASSAKNNAIARKPLTRLLPTKYTNKTNRYPLEACTPSTLSEKILSKIRCTKASAIQFLVVVSLAPSMAVPAVDSQTFNTIVQVTSTMTRGQDSTSTEETEGQAEESANEKEKSSVDQPDIASIPLPEIGENSETIADIVSLDVCIPPPIEFSSDTSGMETEGQGQIALAMPVLSSEAEVQEAEKNLDRKVVSEKVGTIGSLPSNPASSEADDGDDRNKSPEIKDTEIQKGITVESAFDGESISEINNQGLCDVTNVLKEEPMKLTEEVDLSQPYPEKLNPRILAVGIDKSDESTELVSSPVISSVDSTLEVAVIEADSPSGKNITETQNPKENAESEENITNVTGGIKTEDKPVKDSLEDIVEHVEEPKQKTDSGTITFVEGQSSNIQLSTQLDAKDLSQANSAPGELQSLNNAGGCPTFTVNVVGDQPNMNQVMNESSDSSDMVPHEAVEMNAQGFPSLKTKSLSPTESANEAEMSSQKSEDFAQGANKDVATDNSKVATEKLKEEVVSIKSMPHPNSLSTPEAFQIVVAGETVINDLEKVGTITSTMEAASNEQAMPVNKSDCSSCSGTTEDSKNFDSPVGSNNETEICKNIALDGGKTVIVSTMVTEEAPGESNRNSMDPENQISKDVEIDVEMSEPEDRPKNMEIVQRTTEPICLDPQENNPTSSDTLVNAEAVETTQNPATPSEQSEVINISTTSCKTVSIPEDETQGDGATAMATDALEVEACYIERKKQLTTEETSVLLSAEIDPCVQTPEVVLRMSKDTTSCSELTRDTSDKKSTIVGLERENVPCITIKIREEAVRNVSVLQPQEKTIIPEDISTKPSNSSMPEPVTTSAEPMNELQSIAVVVSSSTEPSVTTSVEQNEQNLTIVHSSINSVPALSEKSENTAVLISEMMAEATVSVEAITPSADNTGGVPFTKAKASIESAESVAGQTVAVEGCKLDFTENDPQISLKVEDPIEDCPKIIAKPVIANEEKLANALAAPERISEPSMLPLEPTPDLDAIETTVQSESEETDITGQNLSNALGEQPIVDHGTINAESPVTSQAADDLETNLVKTPDSAEAIGQGIQIEENVITDPINTSPRILPVNEEGGPKVVHVSKTSGSISESSLEPNAFSQDTAFSQDNKREHLSEFTKVDHADVTDTSTEVVSMSSEIMPKTSEDASEIFGSGSETSVNASKIVADVSEVPADIIISNTEIITPNSARESILEENCSIINIPETVESSAENSLAADKDTSLKSAMENAKPIGKVVVAQLVDAVEELASDPENTIADILQTQHVKTSSESTVITPEVLDDSVESDISEVSSIIENITSESVTELVDTSTEVNMQEKASCKPPELTIESSIGTLTATVNIDPRPTVIEGTSDKEEVIPELPQTSREVSEAPCYQEEVSLGSPHASPEVSREILEVLPEASSAAAENPQGSHTEVTLDTTATEPTSSSEGPTSRHENSMETPTILALPKETPSETKIETSKDSLDSAILKVVNNVEQIVTGTLKITEVASEGTEGISMPEVSPTEKLPELEAQEVNLVVESSPKTEIDTSSQSTIAVVESELKALPETPNLVSKTVDSEKPGTKEEPEPSYENPTTLSLTLETNADPSPVTAINTQASIIESTNVTPLQSTSEVERISENTSSELTQEALEISAESTQGPAIISRECIPEMVEEKHSEASEPTEILISAQFEDTTEKTSKLDIGTVESYPEVQRTEETGPIFVDDRVNVTIGTTRASLAEDIESTNPTSPEVKVSSSAKSTEEATENGSKAEHTEKVLVDANPKQVPPVPPSLIEDHTPKSIGTYNEVASKTEDDDTEPVAKPKILLSPDVPMEIIQTSVDSSPDATTEPLSCADISSDSGVELSSTLHGPSTESSPDTESVAEHLKFDKEDTIDIKDSVTETIFNAINAEDEVSLLSKCRDSGHQGTLQLSDAETGKGEQPNENPKVDTRYIQDIPFELFRRASTGNSEETSDTTASLKDLVQPAPSDLSSSPGNTNSVVLPTIEVQDDKGSKILVDDIMEPPSDFTDSEQISTSDIKATSELAASNAAENITSSTETSVSVCTDHSIKPVGIIVEKSTEPTSTVELIDSDSIQPISKLIEVFEKKVIESEKPVVKKDIAKEPDSENVPETKNNAISSEPVDRPVPEPSLCPASSELEGVQVNKPPDITEETKVIEQSTQFNLEAGNVEKISVPEYEDSTSASASNLPEECSLASEESSSEVTGSDEISIIHEKAPPKPLEEETITDEFSTATHSAELTITATDSTPVFGHENIEGEQPRADASRQPTEVDSQIKIELKPEIPDIVSIPVVPNSSEDGVSTTAIIQVAASELADSVSPIIMVDNNKSSAEETTMGSEFDISRSANPASLSKSERPASLVKLAEAAVGSKSEIETQLPVPERLEICANFDDELKASAAQSTNTVISEISTSQSGINVETDGVASTIELEGFSTTTTAEPTNIEESSSDLTCHTIKISLDSAASTLTASAPTQHSNSAPTEVSPELAMESEHSDIESVRSSFASKLSEPETGVEIVEPASETSKVTADVDIEPTDTNGESENISEAAVVTADLISATSKSLEVPQDPENPITTFTEASDVTSVEEKEKSTETNATAVIAPESAVEESSKEVEEPTKANIEVDNNPAKAAPLHINVTPKESNSVDSVFSPEEAIIKVDPEPFTSEKPTSVEFVPEPEEGKFKENPGHSASQKLDSPESTPKPENGVSSEYININESISGTENRIDDSVGACAETGSQNGSKITVEHIPETKTVENKLYNQSSATDITQEPTVPTEPNPEAKRELLCTTDVEDKATTVGSESTTKSESRTKTTNVDETSEAVSPKDVIEQTEPTIESAAFPKVESVSSAAPINSDLPPDTGQFSSLLYDPVLEAASPTAKPEALTDLTVEGPPVEELDETSNKQSSSKIKNDLNESTSESTTSTIHTEKVTSATLPISSEVKSTFESTTTIDGSPETEQNNVTAEYIPEAMDFEKTEVINSELTQDDSVNSEVTKISETHSESPENVILTLDNTNLAPEITIPIEPSAGISVSTLNLTEKAIDSPGDFEAPSTESLESVQVLIECDSKTPSGTDDQITQSVFNVVETSLKSNEECIQEPTKQVIEPDHIPSKMEGSVESETPTFEPEHIATKTVTEKLQTTTADSQIGTIKATPTEYLSVMESNPKQMSCDPTLNHSQITSEPRQSGQIELTTHLKPQLVLPEISPLPIDSTADSTTAPNRGLEEIASKSKDLDSSNHAHLKVETNVKLEAAKVVRFKLDETLKEELTLDSINSAKESEPTEITTTIEPHAEKSQSDTERAFNSAPSPENRKPESELHSERTPDPAKSDDELEQISESDAETTSDQATSARKSGLENINEYPIPITACKISAADIGDTSGSKTKGSNDGSIHLFSQSSQTSERTEMSLSTEPSNPIDVQNAEQSSTIAELDPTPAGAVSENVAKVTNDTHGTLLEPTQSTSAITPEIPDIAEPDQEPIQEPLKVVEIPNDRTSACALQSDQSAKEPFQTTLIEPDSTIPPPTVDQVTEVEVEVAPTVQSLEKGEINNVKTFKDIDSTTQDTTNATETNLTPETTGKSVELVSNVSQVTASEIPDQTPLSRECGAASGDGHVNLIVAISQPETPGINNCPESLVATKSSTEDCTVCPEPPITSESVTEDTIDVCPEPPIITELVSEDHTSLTAENTIHHRSEIISNEGESDETAPVAIAQPSKEITAPVPESNSNTSAHTPELKEETKIEPIPTDSLNAIDPDTNTESIDVTEGSDCKDSKSIGESILNSTTSTNELTSRPMSSTMNPTLTEPIDEPTTQLENRSTEQSSTVESNDSPVLEVNENLIKQAETIEGSERRSITLEPAAPELPHPIVPAHPTEEPTEPTKIVEEAIPEPIPVEKIQSEKSDAEPTNSSAQPSSELVATIPEQTSETLVKQTTYEEAIKSTTDSVVTTVIETPPANLPAKPTEVVKDISEPAYVEDTQSEKLNTEPTSSSANPTPGGTIPEVASYTDSINIDSPEAVCTELPESTSSVTKPSEAVPDLIDPEIIPAPIGPDMTVDENANTTKAQLETTSLPSHVSADVPGPAGVPEQTREVEAITAIEPASPSTNIKTEFSECIAVPAFEPGAIEHNTEPEPKAKEFIVSQTSIETGTLSINTRNEMAQEIEAGLTNVPLTAIIEEIDTTQELTSDSIDTPAGTTNIDILEHAPQPTSDCKNVDSTTGATTYETTLPQPEITLSINEVTSTTPITIVPKSETIDSSYKENEASTKVPSSLDQLTDVVQDSTVSNSKVFVSSCNENEPVTKTPSSNQLTDIAPKPIILDSKIIDSNFGEGKTLSKAVSAIDIGPEPVNCVDSSATEISDDGTTVLELSLESTSIITECPESISTTVANSEVVDTVINQEPVFENNLKSETEAKEPIRSQVSTETATSSINDRKVDALTTVAEEVNSTQESASDLVNAASEPTELLQDTIPATVPEVESKSAYSEKATSAEPGPQDVTNIQEVTPHSEDSSTALEPIRQTFDCKNIDEVIPSESAALSENILSIKEAETNDIEEPAPAPPKEHLKPSEIIEDITSEHTPAEVFQSKKFQEELPSDSTRFDPDVTPQSEQSKQSETSDVLISNKLIAPVKPALQSTDAMTESSATESPVAPTTESADAIMMPNLSPESDAEPTGKTGELIANQPEVARKAVTIADDIGQEAETELANSATSAIIEVATATQEITSEPAHGHRAGIELEKTENEVSIDSTKSPSESAADNREATLQAEILSSDSCQTKPTEDFPSNQPALKSIGADTENSICSSALEAASKLEDAIVESNLALVSVKLENEPNKVEQSENEIIAEAPKIMPHDPANTTVVEAGNAVPKSSSEPNKVAVEPEDISPKPISATEIISEKSKGELSVEYVKPVAESTVNLPELETESCHYTSEPKGPSEASDSKHVDSTDEAVLSEKPAAHETVLGSTSNTIKCSSPDSPPKPSSELAAVPVEQNLVAENNVQPTNQSEEIRTCQAKQISEIERESPILADAVVDEPKTEMSTIPVEVSETERKSASEATVATAEPIETTDITSEPAFESEIVPEVSETEKATEAIEPELIITNGSSISENYAPAIESQPITTKFNLDISDTVAELVSEYALELAIRAKEPDLESERQSVESLTNIEFEESDGTDRQDNSKLESPDIELDATTTPKGTSSSSEDVSTCTYETAPSSFTELLGQTSPSNLTEPDLNKDSIEFSDLSSIPPPTEFKTNIAETVIGNEEAQTCGGFEVQSQNVEVLINEAPESIKIHTEKYKDETKLSIDAEIRPNSPRFEFGQEAILTLDTSSVIEDSSDSAIVKDDSQELLPIEKNQEDDQQIKIVEMEGTIYINPDYAPPGPHPWRMQRAESEDSFVTADSSELDPDVSITPPEISICYMTSTILESIPEDQETSESLPELGVTDDGSTEAETVQSIEDDFTSNLMDDTFSVAEDLNKESEVLPLDTDNQILSDDFEEGLINETDPYTTQQEIIQSSHPLEIIEFPTFANINTDSMPAIVELSTLPTDKLTSTESSSTTTTTTDDTVCTAIESPSRKAKEEIPTDSPVESHKDSTSPSSTSPVKRLYSTSMSLELTNEPTNNTNSEQSTQEACSTVTNESITTATTAPTTTTPLHVTVTSNDNTAPPNIQERHIKLETLKNAAFSQPLSDEEDAVQVGHLSNLLPGSIAEREHKKWYNAVDMPNNPYSKEALKKRLSNTSDRPIDIPNINSPLEQAKSEDKIKEESGANKIISDANKLDYKRYGRDYYINDAKFTSNGNKSKLTASTSLYSLNTTDDKSRDKELSLQLQQPLSSSLSSLHRSHSWGDKRSNIVPDGGSSNCDIFTARPVRVEESDPILSKATKLEYLSTPDRDFYLLPTEEISSLRSISASEHSLSQAGDSLTPSEDSDTIRVYDLKTQETRLIRDDESIIAVTAVKGLNKTDTNRVQHPASSRPQLSTQRSIRTTVVNRGSTPTAFKFLQPKRRLYDTRRVMSEDTSSPTYDRENVSRSNGTPEKSVIEEDVLPALPSVKALMKAFQNPSQDSNVQLNRPKSYSWKSVENNTKEEPTAPAQPPKLAEPQNKSPEKAEPIKEEKQVHFEEVPATAAAPSSETENRQEEVTNESVQTAQPEKLIDLSPMSQQVSEPIGEPLSPQEPCKDSYSPPYDQKYCPAEPETAQAPEEKANEQNSLEWKDENVEIVSIPKDEQQATPPNTPDDANQETPVQSTLIVMVTPKEESTPEPAQATPAREPTVVEKFIENEKQASMPPVDVKPAVEPEQKPTPEVVETETAPNPSTEPTALVEPTPTPAPVAESTQSSITEPSPVQTTETTAAPVSTPAEEKDPEIPAASSPEPVAENSQQTVETQPAENGFHEASPASPPPEVNDELPKQSIVEQKRAEIRFTQESPVRERPISPVLVPGKLKSSIAFFENLNKK